MNRTITLNGAGDPESFVPATLRSLATAAVTTILLSGVKVAVLPPRPLLPVVRFHGGSGGFAKAGVEDITLTSDSGTLAEAVTVIGVEVSGQDGVAMRRCVFGQLDVGVLFHNEDSGSFTEYAQVCGEASSSRR